MDSGSGGAAYKLKINDGNLQKGHASLVQAKAFFDQLQDGADDAADACGHAGLAGALRTSSSNWSLRRGKLSKALENLAGHLGNALTTFGNVDEELASAMSSDAAPTSVPASGSSSPAAAASPIGVSGTPAPVEPTAGVPGSFSAGAAAQPLVAHDADAPGTPVSGGTGPDLPPVAGTTPSSPAADGAGEGLANASLEQLLHALVDRWMSLGGTERTLLAALTGSGLGAALLAGRPRGGGRGQGGGHADEGPHPSRDGESHPEPHRGGRPDGSVPGGGADGPPTDPEQVPTDDENVADPEASPDPVAAATDAAPLVETPAWSASAFTSEGTTAPESAALMEDARGPLTEAPGISSAASEAPLPPLAPSGGDSSAPVLLPLPSLEGDGGEAARPASGPGGAPVPPPLGERSTALEASGHAALPALTDEGAGAALAASAPLSAAALTRSGPMAGGAAGAPLPSLASPPAASGTGGSVAPISEQETRDARAVLDDLRRARQEGE